MGFTKKTKAGEGAFWGQTDRRGVERDLGAKRECPAQAVWGTVALSVLGVAEQTSL